MTTTNHGNPLPAPTGAAAPTRCAVCQKEMSGVGLSLYGAVFCSTFCASLYERRPLAAEPLAFCNNCGRYIGGTDYDVAPSKQVAGVCVECAADPAARAPARAGTTEPDDATLLKDLEESYRADHRFATVADHPAIKDRVDRDVDSAIEPIAARLATLRAEVSRLRAAVVAHRSAKAVRTGAS